MTTLDVLIIVVAAAAAIVGWWKGVIVQAGSVGAVVAAVLLSRIGGDALARVIAGDGEISTVDVILAKVILFIAGYLGVRVLARLFKKATHAVKLGIFDRLGGVAFSLFEWMLLLSLFLNLWLVIKPDTSIASLSTIGNGSVALYIVDLAPAVLGWALDFSS